MLLPYCDGVEELGWFWAELNCQGKPSPWLEVRQRVGLLAKLMTPCVGMGPSQYLMAGSEGHCQGAAGHGKGWDDLGRTN